MASSFTVLENNPAVMSHLAYRLGLSRQLAFHDVLSLQDPDVSGIQRPVFAILAIIPLTETWAESREEEDGRMDSCNRTGESERVLWFKQTIPHACGIIGLLHCLCNGTASRHILPESFLDRLRTAALELPLPATNRPHGHAALLEESDELRGANEAAAQMCHTARPDLGETERLGQHFVAFVKGDDGHLWELEGSRKGPIDRGALEENEDVLSAKAVDAGLGRIISQEQARSGDLRFSCIALASALV